MPRTIVDYSDAGVYMLKNRRTGARYVGASFRLAKRFRTHRNRATDRTVDRTNDNLFFACFAWIKPEDLIFVILERMDFTSGAMGLAKSRQYMRDREQHWINKLKPEANTRISVSTINLVASESEPSAA